MFPGARTYPPSDDQVYFGAYLQLRFFRFDQVDGGIEGKIFKGDGIATTIADSKSTNCGYSDQSIIVTREAGHENCLQRKS